MAMNWDWKLEAESPGATPIGHCEGCDEVHMLDANGLCDYCNVETLGEPRMSMAAFQEDEARALEFEARGE